MVMTTYALQLLDDPVTRYTVHADEQRIGEIRCQAMHACVLHLGEQRFWLLQDEVASATAAGGSLLSRFVNKLRLNRGYTLRDEREPLARARRHWNPLRKRDWIDFDPLTSPPLRATPRGMLDSNIDLTRDGAAAGAMRVVGLMQDRVTLACAGFDPVQAAFLMYVVHHCWGNDPHVKMALP